MSEPLANEIVIEIDAVREHVTDQTVDQSGQLVGGLQKLVVQDMEVYFFPAEAFLRSAFEPWRSGPGVPPALNYLRRVPGQRVHLDIKAKRIRYTDPLGDKANEAILAEVNHAGAQLEPPRGPYCPRPDIVYERLPEDSLTTCEYWMRRLLNESKAIEVQNCDKIRQTRALRETGHVLLPTNQGDPSQKGSHYPIPAKEDADLASAASR